MKKSTSKKFEEKFSKKMDMLSAYCGFDAREIRQFITEVEEDCFEQTKKEILESTYEWLANNSELVCKIHDNRNRFRAVNMEKISKQLRPLVIRGQSNK